MSRKGHTRKYRGEERHYYRFKGYTDGSGRPAGWIIKCLTNEQVDRYRTSGLEVYERIG